MHFRGELQNHNVKTCLPESSTAALHTDYMRTPPSHGSGTTASIACHQSWHRHAHAQLGARHGVPLRQRAVLGKAGLLERSVLLNRRRRLRAWRTSCLYNAYKQLYQVVRQRLPCDAPQASGEVPRMVQATHRNS